MLLTRRLGVAVACACVIAGAYLLIAHSHAQARNRLTFAHLNNAQKRILSQTLASALKRGSQAHTAAANGGGGADGAPNTPPSTIGPASGTASLANYTPSPAGKCSSVLGNNVKVNQNCLNIADSTLQGRSQANNETSIAQDPFDSGHIVASDNNYIRGDGTCGAHFSLDGGRTWSDSTVPNSFIQGPPGFAREYWQASGDTSVAWDTRGNAYLSCQVFNRGAPVSPNPDASSGFLLFRSTGNDGASWNFPGRSPFVFFDNPGTANTLEDKQLMTVDDNVRSPFRDRIYVTWTEFAADGTAYIYEVHSNDYGESFSPRVLVSQGSGLCTNTLGIPTPAGACNNNQFSQPFVGPDGNLYVVWDNYNNRPATGTDNRFQILLAKSTDGGDSFSAPVKVSDFYDLPDCDTYQGTGADPGVSCVPEQGPSTKSVFRAASYPSGQVDPNDPNTVTVTFGSYINRDSNESNGCVPNGVASPIPNPLYKGVKTPGACSNKILLSVSTNGGATFTGTSTDPRQEALVTGSRRQANTDQWWQWSTYTRDGKLAVSYYDRQYGQDEVTGSSDFSLSGSRNLTDFGQVRVTSSSMPAPTQFPSANGGVFFGDYTGLAAIDKAHPIWMDTRAKDLFVCPGTATPGNPPTLCGATEPNGEQANDQEIYTATLGVPSGGHGR
jgi:hypothetical protein